MPNKTTPGQRVAELLRELSMKQRYYPTWIDNHRRGQGQKPAISPEDAEHRIACFMELVEDIYRLYPSLRPAEQGSFFPKDEGRKPAYHPSYHPDRP